jgi:hypothetical protein
MVSVVIETLVGDAKEPLDPMTVPPRGEAPPGPSLMFTPLRVHWYVTFEYPLAGAAARVTL